MTGSTRAVVPTTVRMMSEKGGARHDGPVRDLVRATSELTTDYVRTPAGRVQAATQPDLGQTPPVYDRGLSGVSEIRAVQALGAP